ncbi:AAC(3)-I family aminoglycoside N-acetyltransferase [Ruixingdingia sedimenti]|uniref:AAC(3)-I family aminoglycoside N-acetyltransferase n=1 Tax=Ruixingdingia sedimenti TaxID=3073604 RepID=A0ABU1FDL7_9RHOB|nr:AAC(3)-I family aminoglycoside N-acetyltransferase [Xinfangfangia sp. LG-4]MDR5654972.1 AAC(3)-I family aminoglycoside N-acetyltransferase [Xinfangfangia sp. LG-4]
MAGIDLIRLGPQDLALMRGLLDLFGAVFDEPQTCAGDPPPDDWLRGMLAGDGFIALAAVAGDHVVGGLAAYVLPKFESARREIYLYDLAVAETHRRRGIARGLIRLLQQEARHRGAWVIFVQADRGDAPAIALYESLGRREEVLHFDIPPAGR